MIPRKIISTLIILTFSGLCFIFTPSVVDAARADWWLDLEVQQQLQLSPEQVEKIGAVEEQFAPQLRAMKIEKQKAYKNMIRHLDSKDLSEKDFAEAQAQMETVYGAHAAATADRWKALRGTMSLTQWKNLPKAAPRVLALGSIATSFRGKVKLGGPSKDGN